ncbi:pyruvate formate-lyase-activating protein [Pectinatus frisingensis]|uniref:pyruvate formate-lyase-activating protein n=1 Tax=Pectinatus frisingensis TaxID=865 RepID=UPI0018C4D04E
MKGYYHSKETFGTVDGTGIRYVLFLAGCKLQCIFCHNPDTWQHSEKMIDSKAVLHEVNEYRNFYEASGGGITVSGGEPLLQPDFVAELFSLCHDNKIDTTLDTAGFCSKIALLKVLPYTDHVLFSLKAATIPLHRKLTAEYSNRKIIENLQIVAKRKPVTLRYVILPEITDTQIEMTALVNLIHSLRAVNLKVDLLPYHKMGIEKWNALKMPYLLKDLEPPSAAAIVQAKNKLQSAGICMAY